jgi:hypothetical protein
VRGSDLLLFLTLVWSETVVAPAAKVGREEHPQIALVNSVSLYLQVLFLWEEGFPQTGLTEAGRCT